MVARDASDSLRLMPRPERPAGRARRAGSVRGYSRAVWRLNTDAHIRSALVGRSETIPVIDGRIELGEFGQIYLVDFDGVRDRTRTVHFQVGGE